MCRSYVSTMARVGERADLETRCLWMWQLIETVDRDRVKIRIRVRGQSIFYLQPRIECYEHNRCLYCVCCILTCVHLLYQLHLLVISLRSLRWLETMLQFQFRFSSRQVSVTLVNLIKSPNPFHFLTFTVCFCLWSVNRQGPQSEVLEQRQCQMGVNNLPRVATQFQSVKIHFWQTRREFVTR